MRRGGGLEKGKLKKRKENKEKNEKSSKWAGAYSVMPSPPRPPIKGSDRQSEVVELSMQSCAQIN